jgi:hypothetical protein
MKKTTQRLSKTQQQESNYKQLQALGYCQRLMRYDIMTGEPLSSVWLTYEQPQANTMIDLYKGVYVLDRV